MDLYESQNVKYILIQSGFTTKYDKKNIEKSMSDDDCEQWERNSAKSSWHFEIKLINIPLWWNICNLHLVKGSSLCLT